MPRKINVKKNKPAPQQTPTAIIDRIAKLPQLDLDPVHADRLKELRKKRDDILTKLDTPRSERLKKKLIPSATTLISRRSQHGYVKLKNELQGEDD